MPGTPAAPPVRIVHLGVGNFHRAHQAWYTAHAADADAWGIAAFTGRRPDVADALAPQDGLYTLITRSAEGDAYEVVGSLAEVHPAADHERFLGHLARPEVAVVTITVTERGYVLDRDGHLDAGDEVVRSDVAALREDPRAAVISMPARLVGGLLARRAAGAGTITLLSCDNLPDNGAVTASVVTELTRLVDDTLPGWVEEHVDFATSMVDRITPATTDEDRRLVAETQGYVDAEPVPTEPFHEWVVSGRFPAGRPAWETAGVTLVDDVTPFEQRKLWLLNGSHSLLAYAASIRGHATIDEAVADPLCRAWVEQLWDEACRHLTLPADALTEYRRALLERFGNPRVRHLLAQIAADGSTKLGVRILPVLRAERSAGRVPTGCATTLAAWVLHLRGAGAPVRDAGAGPAREAAAAEDLRTAVVGVLDVLAPGLGDDAPLVDAVLTQAEELRPTPTPAPTADDRVWLDPARAPRERALALVAAMTLEQKIAQLHGAMATGVDLYALTAAAPENGGDPDLVGEPVEVVRHVDEIDELGIPRFRITNGPVGVGLGDGTPSPAATSLPMTIGLAAGFDLELARRYGDLIGSETATLGQHVLEGPGVCLHRTIVSGRNFEYFSEDPYLTGAMAVAVARAIQDHGVIAMAKHFVLNDQEHERFRTSVEVEERVLRELYLLPFEMLVKDAGIAAVMSAYNRIRGVFASEYRHTLTEVLRHDWGFEGYVQSDFWSARSAVASLNAGLDHEMPDSKWFDERTVKRALAETAVEIETVDRALVRRFTPMFRLGQFERPYAPGAIDAVGHGAAAREIGAQIAVLLKNDGAVLPLDPHVGSIVIIGQSTFVDEACLGGGGSSKVIPLYTVPPLEGLRDVLDDLGSSAEVTRITVADDLSDLERARTAATAADAVVIMAGLVATEGWDQPDAHLMHDQDRMITELLGLNPRTVVVLKDGNPVLMPWVDRAPAVLEVWNQGAEDGHVVADLLLGVVNPSGKVPTTYPRSADDTLHAGRPERYPGTDEGDGYPVIRYSEGLEMGYRWFQAQGIEPLFGFGHGLSYTTFVLDDVVVDTADAGRQPMVVTARVTNTGTVAGAEVVQVYLGVPVEGEPPKRLVGFGKVHLAAGASAAVTITVDPAATHHPFGVWDDGHRAFVVVPGEYTVFVGTSAADTPHRTPVRVG
nr:glycoside hydrolase family 3 C-terminal domain-containing protein [Microlunatus antarcticus]